MSAPSESAATPSPCACTNISLMQLFHELKQKFPGVPDHVVSNTIELYCHDKQACETHLHSEVKASLTHAYHASSVAAARLAQPRVNPPGKCRNQPIIQHDVARPIPVHAVPCPGPQTAVLSSPEDNKQITLNTDANQNIVDLIKDDSTNNLTSPVAVINIDNCCAKYSAESSSDLELTNENTQEKHSKDEILNETETNNKTIEHTNYQILKSNRVKYNLHEGLEKEKEKKTIQKEEPKAPSPIQQEKPKRPNTLDFIKPNPDIAFKQPSNEPTQPSPTHTATSSHKLASPSKEAKPQSKYEKFPVNFSVNVNCHMDLNQYDYEDYDSPRAITSVNLTVCTPSSNMASPVRDEEGFEGHVTVTVSPSAGRPMPRRRAPPPPPHVLESPRPTRAAPEPPGLRNERSLIERQKERLNRLAAALAVERARLAQLTKERKILAAPTPTPVATQMLKEDVERLRDMCDNLSKRLESAGSEPVDSDSFYSNIYTGQQPPPFWQCHMCTLRNHPLLDTCEGCDMRRILVVRSPEGITVRLMPGRRKFIRSWVL